MAWDAGPARQELTPVRCDLHRRGPIHGPGKDIRQAPCRRRGQPAGHVRVAEVGIHDQQFAFDALGQPRRQAGDRHRFALAIAGAGEQQGVRTAPRQLLQNSLGGGGMRVGGNRHDNQRFGVIATRVGQLPRRMFRDPQPTWNRRVGPPRRQTPGADRSSPPVKTNPAA